MILPVHNRDFEIAFVSIFLVVLLLKQKYVGFRNPARCENDNLAGGMRQARPVNKFQKQTSLLPKYAIISGVN
jgi:hypothetical protein